MIAYFSGTWNATHCFYRLAAERLVDDDQFKDKEKFVTSGYKQKLQEDALWKEKQLKINAQEEANAVHKRGAAGGTLLCGLLHFCAPSDADLCSASMLQRM
jgi:hypothetical protein